MSSKLDRRDLGAPDPGARLRGGPDLGALEVAGRPDGTAVVAPDAVLTYAELSGRADDLARHLRQLGVVEGALVGVCLPRSAVLVVGWLAVLRAGAAYVALDPSLPHDRLVELVADSGVALVLAGSGAGLGTPDGYGVVRVAESGRRLDAGLAYVTYTSGSTGTPKGVLVERAGVVQLARWHAAAFGVDPGTRCSLLAGVGFDAAAWEVWGALRAGATLVVPPESVKTDPGALRDWLVAERVEVAFAPTPLAAMLVRRTWPAGTALRFLLTGGDRLQAAPPAGLPFALVNAYGVTEASVVSTAGVVPPGLDGAPSIGAPIDGVRVRVVDEDLAASAEGELLVGGVSVARGCLGAPELTAERLPTLADGRWYRTGDRVRRLPDGELAFLGRVDDQIQIRGFRVEPAEIEGVLVRHPDVAAAAVRLVDDRLVAWVHGEPDPDDLRRHLERWLPDHMRPGVVLRTGPMPVTANGKVDVAALPRPAAAVGPADVTDAEPDDEPADDLTAAVAAAVAELLHRPAVGATENFLLLGGHSLLAAQLVARLSDAYGVELGLREVFADPTPAGIAAQVRQLVVDQILAGQPA